MSGSVGALDWLTKLFSSGAGASAATSMADASAAMNPALIGQAAAANATVPSAGGMGASSKDLVSALQGAGKGVSGMQEQQMRPNVTTPMASSQAVPGRGQDLGTLLQLLQQRNQYGMGSGSTSGGLLGVR